MATVGGSRRPRIACVQLDSKHADVEANARQVEALTSRFEPGELDMVVLPEMALTGYVFGSAQEIQRLIERPFDSPPQSPSLQLAAKLATRLRSYVIIGLPFYGSEMRSGALSSPFDARPAEAKAKESVSPGRGPYNGALLVDPNGHVIHAFRKHFLFETDETWARQGPGFELIHVPRLGKICVAICMDLNPWNFEAEESKCELATFCKEADVDGLIVTMAWLRSRAAAADDDHGLSVINYWAMRLRPLLSVGIPMPESAAQSASRPRFFIAANRSGTEQGLAFAGSSCALQIDSEQRPILIGRLRETEGVLVAEI
ncbi:carbon-nitrogen hydrolase [Acaromyces ingoldii]|uniref:Carbon-nitrogen hydrolase n=1 Tax=Acaromyces ingoldii TaxID=215250 RepID=A0A316YD11_9BASI|nr:carbon-nitrogen hydrolase [Acaromyces ingoldii]PWN87550.1 carbon-nitrogen hydrolase [Acaromyces ingoldii]